MKEKNIARKQNEDLFEKRTKILLVKEDEFKQGQIIFFLETYFNLEVLSLKVPAEVFPILEKDPQISLILCNFNLKNQGFETLVQGLAEKTLAIPVLGLSTPPETISNIRSQNVIGHLPPDYTLNDLQKFLGPLFNEDSSQAPNDYCQIQIEPLLSFSQFPEDIYLRLSSEKFIKIFHKNDSLEEEDILKWKRRGIKNLFVRKRTAHWSPSPNLQKALMVKEGQEIQDTKEEVTNEKAIKEETVPSTSEPIVLEPQILEIIPFKLDREMIKAVANKVDDRLKSIKKNPKLNKLSQLLDQMKVDKNNYLNGHIDILCTIMHGLCRELEWHTEATLEKLVFVAHFHDLLFAHTPELAEIQTKAALEAWPKPLTEKEKQLVLSHPQATAEIVRQIADAPNEADLIILQHHERPDQSGFPSGLMSQRITPLSSLFIVSHDLSNYIMSHPQWDLKTYLEENNQLFKGSNFIKLQKALEKMK